MNRKKIELELPEWANERHIRIFAGIELIAYRKVNEDKFNVKCSRCNFCGKCCMNVRVDHIFGRDEKTGNCRWLRKNGDTYECGLGMGRPFSCSASVPIHIPECTEKFKKVI